MIDTIDDLRTFTRIVEAGSLSRAAASMGVTLNSVSKRLASLEQRAEKRLINRTTRRLAPTDAGTAFYRQAVKILDAIEEAESDLRGFVSEPNGLLRVSAPIALGKHVAPICLDIARSTSNLSVDLFLSDRIVDLAEEHFDVSVRLGDIRDQTVIVRKIADNDQYIVASPGFLKSCKEILHPFDLAEYTCLTSDDFATSWQLKSRDGERCEVKLSSSKIRCNNDSVVYDWAVNGAGFMLKSSCEVADDLRSGRLVRILSEWHSDLTPIYITYLSSRLKSAKVTKFMEALELRLLKSEAKRQ